MVKILVANIADEGATAKDDSARAWLSGEDSRRKSYRGLHDLFLVGIAFRGKEVKIVTNGGFSTE